MKIERSVNEQRKLDRFGRCESARLCYVTSRIDGMSTGDVVAAVFSEAPEYQDGIPKNSVEILRSPGGDTMEIAVNYREPDYFSRKKRASSGHSAGDREWTVEVNARSSVTYTSLGCLRSISADGSGNVVSPGVLLGWNGKRGASSKSGGIKVYVPEVTATCVATFRAEKADSRAYMRNLAYLVGKVNSEAFHNWHAGEVLFLGMVRNSIFENDKGAKLCDMTFRFGIRCGGNRFCAGLEIPDVEGWDHVWAVSGSPLEPGKVRSVHVSRIYQRASFSLLDL